MVTALIGVKTFKFEYDIQLNPLRIRKKSTY